MKKVISYLMAVLLVVNTIPFRIAAEETRTEKVAFSVSSDYDGGTTSVSGTVYDDYSAELILPNGKINASNAIVTLTMTDIGSLGIEGTRTASYPIRTNMNREEYLFNVLKLAAQLGGDSEALFDFRGATVNVDVIAEKDEKSVSYKLTGTPFYGAEDEVKKITGTADPEKAREAWQLLIKDHVSAEVKDSNDSYVVIAKGSTLQLGSELLYFAEGEDDLVLDNFNDPVALNTAIRKALELDKNAEGSKFEVNLKAGTSLAVGTSIATLNKDVVITLDGIDSEGLNVLSQLQASSDETALLKGFLVCLNKAVLLADEAEKVNVTIDFGKTEPEVAENVKFKVEVASTASDGSVGSVTGTVYDNYNADLVINGEKVNTGNVSVKVWMQNVGSLGVEGLRSYDRDITLSDSGTDVGLSAISRRLAPLADKETTIIAKANGKEATYTVTYNGTDKAEAATDAQEASALWHEIIDNYTSHGVQDEDDSYILIANGSYLHIAGKQLEFENDQALKLNNLTDLNTLSEQVRNAIRLNTEADMIDYIDIYLEAGTTLALGQSYVVLDEETRISVDITEDLSDILVNLRAADTAEKYLVALMGGMEEIIAAVAGKTTTVEFEMGHRYGESEPKWTWAEDLSSATATFVCDNNPNHETKDYAASITKEIVGNNTKYIASVTVGEKTYTDEKTKTGIDESLKFRLRVSSQANSGTGSVTGTVYDDYKADLIFDGSDVNTGNATVEVWMNNVGSLGVEGTRYYVRPIDTGASDPHDVSMSVVRNLLANLQRAKVVGKIGDERVTYTLSKENDNIYAVPDSTENASGVWHAIVNDEHLSYGTNEKDDSYIVLGKNSYLQLGTYQLIADKAPADGLKIDNLDDLAAAETEIRKAVTLLTDAEAVDQLVLYLEPGSELALGQSFVKLNEDQDLMVTIDIAGYDEAELKSYLTQLQSASDVMTALHVVFSLISDLSYEMDANTTTVEFEFGHKFGEVSYEWAEDNSAVTATALCENNEEHVVTETVETTNEITTEPTCEGTGIRTYTAEFKSEGFETQTKEEEVPATGHDYSDGPEWVWAEDYSSAVATFTCKNDSTHTEELEAAVTKETIEATILNGGSIVYIATVELEGKTYTNTQIVATDPIDYKFVLEVSSKDSTGKKNAVTAIVDPEYVAKLIIDEGNVNTSNIAVSVWMKNVASLGVSDPRNYSKELQLSETGGDVSLDYVVNLFSGLQSATIIGVVDDESTVYSVSNEGRILTAVPDENAPAVWHALVNDTNIEYGVKEDDAKIILKKGSYIQIADRLLKVDSELVIDKIDDIAATEKAIRDAVSLTQTEERADQIIVYLEPESMLALGTSYAKLKEDRDLKISIDVTDFDETSLSQKLDELREARDVMTMIDILMKASKRVMTAMNGNETTVTFELGHKYAEEAEYVWTETEEGYDVTATIPCGNNSDHDITETVKAEYEVTVEPECGKKGTGVYTATFENEAFEPQTKEVEIDALEHVPAEPVKENEAKPTCEEEGSYDLVVYCKRCGEELSRETVTVEALGHLWGEPTYTWEDDFSKVTAEVVCERDPDHKITEEGTITSEVTKEPTALVPGEETFTAVFENELFETQTKTRPIETTDYKFILQVSSEASTGTGAVTAIVLPDYSATLAFTGENVNTSNVTVGVWMKNVASLGVEGVRHYEKPLATGMDPKNVPMSLVKSFFAGLESASVTAKIDDLSTTYAVVNGGDVITATPDENVADVWHAIVNEENIKAETKSEDSYIVLGKGSYVRVADARLSVNSELKMDNFDDLDELMSDIRKAVSLKDDEAIENIEIYLEPGTELALGSSSAVLIRDARITIEIPDYDETALKNGLNELRNARNLDTMIKTVLNMMSDVLTGMNGKETVVTFEFGHRYGEASYEWAEDYSEVTATLPCENNHDHDIVEPVNTVEDETAATCEEAGKIVYTATFEHEEFEEQTKTVETEALGHLWGEEPEWVWADDHSSAKAVFTCERDSDHKQEVEAEVKAVTTDPTCEDTGKTVYTATAIFNETEYTDTFEETIEALGHDWKFVDWTENPEDYSTIIANFVCKRDSSHTDAIEVETEETVLKEATCTDAGISEYKAVLEHESGVYTWDKQIVSDPIGHDWGEPTWEWAEDYSSATATFVCKNDESHVKTEKADVTSEFNPETGMIEHTATVTGPDGKPYSDMKEETAEVTLTLDKETLTINIGTSDVLVATLDPQVSGDTLTWTSSDEDYVKVDQDGTVTGVRPGNATVTVTSSKSGLSASCEVTVIFPAPPLVAIWNSAKGADIRFDAVEGATHYIIKRKYNGTWSDVITVKAEDLKLAGGHLRYIDPEVKDNYGKGYIYSVQAQRIDGDVNVKSDWSTKGLALYRLKQPTITSVKSTTKGQVTVTWTKEVCQGYELQYSDDGGKTWVKVAQINSAATTSQTIKGLKSGTKYAFRVRCQKTNADRGRTWSQYSEWKSIKVK